MMRPIIKTVPSTGSHISTPGRKKRVRRVRFADKCCKLEGTDQRSLSEAELKEKLQSIRNKENSSTSPARAATQSRSAASYRVSDTVKKPKAQTIANHGADALPTQVLFTQKRSNSPISFPTQLPLVNKPHIAQPLPRTKARTIANHGANALPTKTLLVQGQSSDISAPSQRSSLPSPKTEKKPHLNLRDIPLFIVLTASRLYRGIIGKLSLAFNYIKKRFQKLI